MLNVFFDKWWRVGGAAGILFLIMFIVGVVVEGQPPQFDKPADEIRNWFADNGEQFLVGEYLIGLAFAFFFLPFLSSLRGVLAAAEGGAAAWSRVAFAGGLAFFIFGAVASFFLATLAYGFGTVENGDEGTVKTLMYLNQVGFTTAALSAIPLVLGASLVTLRTGVLWRWVPLIALVVIVFVVINGGNNLSSDPDGALGGIGFIGFPAFGLWVLLTSRNHRPNTGNAIIPIPLRAPSGLESSPAAAAIAARTVMIKPTRESHRQRIPVRRIASEAPSTNGMTDRQPIQPKA